MTNSEKLYQHVCQNNFRNGNTKAAQCITSTNL